MLQDCNDIPAIDSSVILWAVLHMPSDHDIGSGNDDDDEQWIDEQNKRNFHIFFWWCIFLKVKKSL